MSLEAFRIHQQNGVGFKNSSTYSPPKGGPPVGTISMDLAVLIGLKRLRRCFLITEFSSKECVKSKHDQEIKKMDRIIDYVNPPGIDH